MRQVTIGPNQAGQRLDKYLRKYLPGAETGFLYKMLRRKNIVLNGKKAAGREILQQGDSVSFFFAEETFLKFAGNGGADRIKDYKNAYRLFGDKVAVLYEDADIAALNKPAGILTQKAEAGDLSLNEWLIGYLLEQGAIDEDGLRSFKPSVCNRLDRNTTGLVLCGKSLAGSQYLSEAIRERRVSKFYRTVCVGELRGDRELEGCLRKDPRANQAQVIAGQNGAPADGRNCYIRTACHPIARRNGYTLLEAELFTGKPHQIRAHLASIGHPVIGDYKYGDRKINDALKAEYGLTCQLLHARRVILEDGREFTAPYPSQFSWILERLGLPL